MDITRTILWYSEPMALRLIEEVQINITCIKRDIGIDQTMELRAGVQTE